MSLEQRFPIWYDTVVPNAPESQVTSRVQAIASHSPNVTSADVPTIVRLFYKLPVPDAARQSFRQALKVKEVADPSQDDAELAVIAAGLIFKVASESSKSADLLSLAVCTTDNAGARKTARVADVVQQCKSYLKVEGTRVRDKDVNLGEFPHQSLATSIGKLKEKHADLEQYAVATDEMLLKINKAVRDYGAQIGGEVARIERRRKEESDIVFLLLTSTSFSDAVPYSSMPSAEVAFRAALDLAAITQDIPGPPILRAILTRLLNSSKDTNAQSKLSFQEAVNGVSEETRRNLAERDKSLDPCLTPFLFAIEKAQESGEGNQWTAAFKNLSGLDPKSRMNLIDIAELVYDELLLVRNSRQK